MKQFFILILTALFLSGISSCKKEAGEGGTSFIKGKVHANYYNKNFSIMSTSKYAPDVDVYIIYADDPTFSERQRTTYDGTYEFKFLQNGTYKIYAYSKDSTGAYNNQVNQYAPDVAVIQQVEITKRKQTVDVPEIHIVQ